MNTMIFIVTHKYFEEPENEVYKTIIVGSQDLKIKGAYRDNVGSNIAYKNSNYCELTALYWIWKNISNINYIGMCHYRRFFSKSKYRSSSKYFLIKKDVEELLDKYDIILPEKNRWSITVGENYCKGEGREKDLLLLREKVIESCPEYLLDFERVVNAKSASYRNMFITRSELLDEYCKWLFMLLSKLEEVISLNGYTQQEARVYGYLSEILLNVWVLHNNLRVKYVPITLTEGTSLKKVKMRFRNIPIINEGLNFFGI